MISYNQLLGKRIFTADGQALGIAQDVLWDKSSAICYIATESGVFSADRISSKKENIFLANAKNAQGGVSLANKNVYDFTGKSAGKICDLFLGATMKLNMIITDNGTGYSRGRIFCANDIVILKREPLTKRTNSSVKRQPAVPQKSVALPSTAEIKAQTIAAPTYPIKRKYGDFSFLIGKIADKTIINFYGEVMLRAGDKVTHDILRQAKLSGKLLELCLHAK